MSDTADAPERVLIDPLVAQLMEASLSATAAATDDVISALQRSLARAEAERDLIRESVSGLLDGPWMPMPDAIRGALWPSRALVDAILDEKETN